MKEFKCGEADDKLYHSDIEASLLASSGRRRRK